MPLLITSFVLSLLIAIGASAWFTRRLEVLSDLWHWSPGLLSLLGALGANIPNYVAALTATISGQMMVGIGIIIGSNIYNIAVILGVSTFASPDRRGILLTRQEASDASLVGIVTLAMMFTTALMVGDICWQSTLLTSSQAFTTARILLFCLNVLIFGLFFVLCFHALHHGKETDSLKKKHEREPAGSLARKKWLIVRLLGEMTLALALALGGVIVMVQSGQTIASIIHLPAAILSLLILAVATSLPNTVVAFTLARTGRASASVEEIFSSNSLNAVLGIALPLFFWPAFLNDRLLALLDGPLMVVLTGLFLFCVYKRRISHTVGLLFLLVYIAWVMLQLFF